MSAAKEILSQAEIDALMGGVDEGAVETAPVGTELEQLDVRPYDLASEDRVIRGRMPGIDNINERFCRLARLSLFNLLNQTVEIGVGGTQVLKYSEYIHTLYLPTSVNLVRLAPLRGTAMLVMDAKLIFRFVDHFFGGTGKHTRIEGREFTRTESRVIRLILKHLFGDLTEAWRKIQPINVGYLGSEVNPTLANACGPNDVLLVNSFHVEVDGGGGEIHVALPFTMLEPIRRRLESAGRGDDADRQPHWAANMHGHLERTTVDLQCVIGEARLTLRDVMAMRPGDVLPIDKPEQHTARVAGVPVFRASLGVSGERLALRVEDLPEAQPARTDTQTQPRTPTAAESRAAAETAEDNPGE